MKKRTAWILVACIAVVAVGAAAAGAVALYFHSRGGDGWGGKRYLLLSLNGELPEQPPPSALGSFLERQPPSLRGLVESLDRAATDPKVTAVVVRLGVLHDAGWGKVQELRDAIARFRQSKKPVYAHVEFCGNKEYYLATACSKIYAVPTALLDVSGLVAEVTFFKKTLDKLGVEAQFEGVGKYKNAPNQFTESSFTEPHREQMEALLDSLFEQYVSAIASGRRRTPEEVRALIDKGPYGAKEALEAGLVDELLYQDDLEKRLKDVRRTSPARYVRSRRGFGLDGRPKLALIYVVGEIVTGESQGGVLGGEGFAGADTIARAIRQARDDEDIKAVILRVDSPGGMGVASDVIWREVGQTRSSKPVVVSMGDTAASGGYYVSMGSDAIVAQPATITGSIGVFGGKLSLRGFYDKIGVNKEILTRGRNAALFTDYRPWTEDERAKVRDLMVDFYRDFVQKAAEGRRRTADEIHAVAQGRVWTGSDALKQGLVDKLGGLDVAVALAKEKARIDKAQAVTLLVLPERKGFLDTLIERQEEGVVEEMLPSDLRSLLRWVRALAQGGVLARMPFQLRVR